MKRYKIRRHHYESQPREVLEQIGDYDDLTGLPNMNYLKKLFENNESEDCLQGTFLAIEIHNFNIIKDAYGYDFGDELLRNAVHLLKKSTEKDTVICRGIGDTFIVFVPYVKDEGDIRLFCKNVFYTFDRSILVKEKNSYLHINIGIAMYPDNGDNLVTILKKADLALYKAKNEGLNKFAFYYEGLQEEILREIAIYNNLKAAINKNELEVYYQPQLEQKLNKIIKFEALLRWNNKELGNVSPSEFIPIAEETGLIIELGEWVLRNVCKQIKRWMNKGYYYAIALNVSQKQIESCSFADNIISVIKEFDIPSDLIEIEITESIIMSSSKANIETLRLIQREGIKIALDDFGTGYSSLSCLKTLPIDTIKIDKSFVDDIVFDENSRNIVDGIISLVKRLQLNVIAEGVEKKEQADLLKDMGCSMIQGYFYSKPVPVSVIEEKYFNLI